MDCGEREDDRSSDQIDPLIDVRIGQLTNREILQMPDASEGFLLYSEHRCEYSPYWVLMA
jgi:hypothetical protein